MTILMPRFWMGFIKYFFKFFDCVVCVYLRCRKTRMTQKIFNSIDLSTFVKQMRGVCVTKNVRALFLNRNFGKKLFCDPVEEDRV